MRHKRLKLGTALLLGFGLSSLQAQTMYVKQIGGTQTAYALSDVRKMTFSSGNMVITKTDNSSAIFSVAEFFRLHIRYTTGYPSSRNYPNLSQSICCRVEH